MIQMEKTLKFEDFYHNLYQMFELLTREELRTIARRFKVPVGRNKYDTMLSLVKHRHNIKMTITISLKEVNHAITNQTLPENISEKAP